MNVLGIETSCDETAVAIVNENRDILSNLIYSQIQEHQKFGGVVPEIAARSHIEVLPDLFRKSLREARLSLEEIDAVAVTGGPGLIGGVMVGVVFAKTIASVIKKPFIAVNHLEGHALTARLTHNIEFPYLLLLASGGHCQILLAEGVSKYKQLSTTIDDAAGEAFDKVAKMLGLEWPGGAALEKLALSGNKKAFPLPMPLCEINRHDFSFSGLKTAVRNIIYHNQHQIDSLKSDICASFQEAVTKVFVYKIEQAITRIHSATNKLVIAGGVASNQYIRNALAKRFEQLDFEMIAPPINLCTDNAAMIAWAGLEQLKLGMTTSLEFTPKSRWPLS